MLEPACGDDALPSPCGIELTGPGYCYAARTEAARTSATLLVAQSDVDIAYRRLKKIWYAGPLILRSAKGRADAVVHQGYAVLATTDPLVVAAAWDAGGPSDVQFADLLAMLPLVSVDVTPSQFGDDDRFFIQLNLKSAISGRLLLDAFPDRADSYWLQETPTGSDVTISEVAGDGGGFVADITIADLSGIAGSGDDHRWRLTVSGDESQTLEDLGGYPCPTDDELADDDLPEPP